MRFHQAALAAKRAMTTPGTRNTSANSPTPPASFSPTTSSKPANPTRPWSGWLPHPPTFLLPSPISTPRAQLYAGIDFGRKNHLTVCWILERLPRSAFRSEIRNHTSETLVTREVLTVQNLSTPEQIEILRPRLQRCRLVCTDYTGAGIGLGDYLAREFCEWRASSHKHGKVELCQFTTALKAELFPRLRAALEKREIREDLHSVQRIVSQNGQISYRAISTADGHSDRCAALALVLRAVQSAPVSQMASTIPGPGFRSGPHIPRGHRFRIA